MPTERPRVQVTLDNDTNALLSILADQNEQSISATAADLIREALELHEDIALSKLSDERISETTKWHNHDDAWQ